MPLVYHVAVDSRFFTPMSAKPFSLNGILIVNMSLLSSFTWVFLTTGLFTLLFKKRFELLCAASLIVAVLFLYISGFIFKISFGFYFIWILPIIFLILLVRALKSEEKRKEFLSNYFSIGFYAFVLFFLIAFLISKNRGFIYYDEISFWGPMVKESLRLDTFYSVPESTLSLHKDYPPFFTLLEILWCYFQGGAFSESACYTALNTFMFSLFLPAFSCFKCVNKKNILLATLVLIAVIITPFTVYTIYAASDGFTVYHSIYVDWCLGLFLAYSLFLVYKLENNIFKLFILGLSFISFLLMKQSGIALFALSFTYFIFKDFIINKSKAYKLRYLFLMIVLSVVPFFVWKLYISNVGASVTAQFQLNQIKISKLLSIASATGGDQWQQQASSNFIYALTNTVIFRMPVNLAYVPHTILIALFAFFFTFNKKQGHPSMLLPIFFLLGSIGYAFMMYLLYTFSFGEYEGPMLASYERYMGSYLYSGICLLTFLFSDTISDFNNKCPFNKIICFAFVIFLPLSTNFSNYKNIIPSNTYDGISSNSYYQRTRFVVGELCKNKKVLIIESYSQPGIYTKKLLDYEFSNDSAISYSVYNINDTLEKEYSLSEWKEYLSNFDYIYLLYPDNNFIDQLWFTVTNTDILNYGLYSIRSNNGELTIDIIGSYEYY